MPEFETRVAEACAHPLTKAVPDTSSSSQRILVIGQIIVNIQPEDSLKEKSMLGRQSTWETQ